MFFEFTLLEIVIGVLIISFLTTALILPKIKSLGEFFKFKDIPNIRKQKQKSLVRIGGIAIFIGFIFAIFSFLIFNENPTNSIYSARVLFTLLGGAFSYFILGLADDIYSLSPFLRLIIQVLIALLVSNSGLNINKIDLAWLDMDPIFIPKIISIFITSFWIVGVTNAINWLDGLDGLAAGISGFASIGLATISFQNGQYLEPILAAGISGSSFGFLRLNFFPAKIIMGDSGSYFLGFMLSAIAILSTSSEINPIGIFVPIMLLIIPILDMTVVIFGRLNKRGSPFIADKTHLHHKLINNGFSELGTVIFIYSFSQWITILSISLSSRNDGLYLVMTIFSSFILFLSFVLTKHVF